MDQSDQVLPSPNGLDPRDSSYRRSYDHPIPTNGNTMTDRFNRFSLSTLQEVGSALSDPNDSMLTSCSLNKMMRSEVEVFYDNEVEIDDPDSPSRQRRSRNANGHGGTPRRKMSSSSQPNYTLVYDNGSAARTMASSRSRLLRHSHKHTKNEHRLQRVMQKEQRLPNNEYAVDYWTLPRKRDIFRRNFRDSGLSYRTPLTMLGSENAHKLRQERRVNSELLDDTETPTEDQPGNENPRASNRNGIKIKNPDNPCRSELKVYFRFSKGVVTDNADYVLNEEFLSSFQACCRAWLARQRCLQRAKKENAVRIIQRNAEVMFDPWMRLMLALRPMLRAHRTEEEILFLQSELERYKTLVKMLRFENAEYQAKVANLLQLIQQINTGGSCSAMVDNLVHQISEALTKNQEFWQEMASKHGALQTSAIHKPPHLDVDGSPLVLRAGQSPITQLRHDAEFYRQQVEMLKEEADEQQQRSTEHFQAQVRTLSDRVEYLQNLLSLESGKVGRLSAELEEMNTTIGDAKTYERQLEHTVTQLSRQLESRAKQEPVVPQEADNMGSPMTVNRDELSLQTDATRLKLQTYKELIEKLRQHFASDPKTMAVLTGTPFQPGGEHDIFTDPTIYHSPLPPVAPAFFNSAAPSPDVNTARLGDMTPRTEVTNQVAVLKRQLTVAERNLQESGAQIQSEIEDRENLENENLELHKRLSDMERKLRRFKEEYDDDLTNRDLTYQRKLKDANEQIDEYEQRISQLLSLNNEFEHQLAEYRNMAEPEDDQDVAEWESLRAKLRGDIMHYKQTLDHVQEEFDQFREKNDPEKIQAIISAKDEQISLLEREKQQWRANQEIQQVHLQSTTSLLEKAENRLKINSRERMSHINRISALEAERDEAIRKAAMIEGRASADKEVALAKYNQLEKVQLERDAIRKELSEVKQTLAGLTAENAAEKRQLQARLRENEVHSEARITDFKAELDRAREEIERLQVEIHTVQSMESESKTTVQQQRWKINEFEDQLELAKRRITTLERQNADLETELIRAKADLTSSREAASLRRAVRSRAADEWMNLEDTDDDEVNLPSLALANSDASSLYRQGSNRSRMTLRDSPINQQRVTKRDSSLVRGSLSRGNSASRHETQSAASTDLSPVRITSPQ